MKFMANFDEMFLWNISTPLSIDYEREILVNMLTFRFWFFWAGNRKTVSGDMGQNRYNSRISRLWLFDIFLRYKNGWVDISPIPLPQISPWIKSPRIAIVDGKIRIFLFGAEGKWGLSIGERGEPGCRQRRQTSLSRLRVRLRP